MSNKYAQRSNVAADAGFQSTVLSAMGIAAQSIIGEDPQSATSPFAYNRRTGVAYEILQKPSDRVVSFAYACVATGALGALIDAAADLPSAVAACTDAATLTAVLSCYNAVCGIKRGQ